MKTIGILGGMGPASTLYYYETLCRLTRERRGGNTSPPVLLHAFDFGEMQTLQQQSAWDEISDKLLSAAKGLDHQGAEILLLATNTMHKVSAPLEERFAERFIHIADAAGARLNAARQKRPALLGTRYTMEEAFYRDRISAAAGADIIVPAADDQARIQDAIFGELVKGVITAKTTSAFIEIAQKLKAAGADSLILGCTEIGLVLNRENCPLPPYDTALIHCEAAINQALETEAN